MATFSERTFSASAYANFRPDYPQSFYDSIISLLAPPSSSSGTTLVDLGCGPAPTSRALSPRFSQVHAVDPSDTMLKTARSLAPTSTFPNITFHTSTASSLPFIPTDSADMIVAGEAAHWFDYSTLWSELSRALRPGGVLAFWLYSGETILGHPKTTQLVIDWMYETRGLPDCKPLHDFWAQPGTDALETGLSGKEHVPPTDMFVDARRVVYTPDATSKEPGHGHVLVEKAGAGGSWEATDGKGSGADIALRMHATLRVRDLKAYMRTWSAVHSWHAAHPARQPRSTGGQGDVIDAMWDEIAAVEGWDSEDKEVQVEWKTVVLVARKI